MPRAAVAASILAVLACLPVATVVAQDALALRVLHCPSMIDVLQARRVGPHSIVIENERIREVRPGRAEVAGAEVIEAPAGSTCRGATPKARAMASTRRRWLNSFPGAKPILNPVLPDRRSAASATSAGYGTWPWAWAMPRPASKWSPP